MISPEVGKRWNSETTNQVFDVTGGPEAVSGLKEWARYKFVGHRAVRRGDRLPSLVGLTSKPPGYPYDYVLL